MATPANYDEAVIKVNAAYLNHEFADRCGWKEFSWSSFGPVS